MTAFRDLMRTRITCKDENHHNWRGRGFLYEDWCVRLDGHLLSQYSTRGIAIDDALQGRNSLQGLKRLVLIRVHELAEQINHALAEDRLDEAVTLCDERANLLSCFLRIRQAWAERLAQNEDAPLPPEWRGGVVKSADVHAVIREMQEAARAAF